MSGNWSLCRWWMKESIQGGWVRCIAAWLTKASLQPLWAFLVAPQGPSGNALLSARKIAPTQSRLTFLSPTAMSLNPLTTVLVVQISLTLHLMSEQYTVLMLHLKTLVGPTTAMASSVGSPPKLMGLICSNLSTDDILSLYKSLKGL